MDSFRCEIKARNQSNAVDNADPAHKTLLILYIMSQIDDI